MPQLELPRFKAAAIQAAPVYLDTDATVDKACGLIREAAGNGATLVAFPEVFVAGYPYWNWVMTPIEGSPWFERLCKCAIELPGPEIGRIAQTARGCGVTVVIGVNERSPTGVGTNRPAGRAGVRRKHQHAGPVRAAGAG